VRRHGGRSCSYYRYLCGRAIAYSRGRKFFVGATGNCDANDVAHSVDHPAGAVTPVRAVGAEPLCCLGSAAVTQCAAGPGRIYVCVCVKPVCGRCGLWPRSGVNAMCAPRRTGMVDKGRRCRGSSVSANVGRLMQARE